MAHQAMTAKSPFAAELYEQLSHLELGHLTIVRDDYDEANFGNAFVVFEAEGILLRFVRDRGLVTVDVGASNRFVSLDFVACRQRWADRAALARHYARPRNLLGFPPTQPEDQPDGIYADLLAALEDSDEAEAERIASRLEVGPETVPSSFGVAPMGPYFGVSSPGSKSHPRANAFTFLADHWSDLAEALADESWLRVACNEEPAFWKSIAREPFIPDVVDTPALTAS